MCGIVGYIGKGKAQEILVAGLQKSEYRGYDDPLSNSFSYPSILHYINYYDFFHNFHRNHMIHRSHNGP